MRAFVNVVHKNLLRPLRFVMTVEDNSCGTFVQKINPLTGKSGWALEDENYDYHQEIARSMYADMLHDYDRNAKYYKALKKAIDIKHGKGQKARVLDIGTGTGLLSMMAANCGADSIVACEGFPPIAEIAKKVIADNNLGDRIKVVSKRSTDLKVGPGLDLECRANVLVTEVFDTELIGEGAVETFNHANKYLLEDDSIIVPWSSDVFAVLLDSKTLSSFNKIESSFPVDEINSVKLPPEMRDCPGNAGVHDLQLSQIPPNQLTILSKPVKVFKFDFFKRITSNETTSHVFQTINSGEANVLGVYWTLDMDQDGETIVSCAPSFVEPTPWRDHWMQAVYHLRKPLEVVEGTELKLIAQHDQFSMWFDVRKANDECTVPLDMPVCSCGLHGIASRTRLFTMNNLTRWSKYVNVMTKIKKNSNVMFIGDASLLPLAAAKAGANKVFCVEDNPLSFSVMKTIIEYNGLSDKVILLKQYNKELITEPIDLVLAEPYFREAVLPWDNMKAWYIAAQMAPNVPIYPAKMTICGALMEFEHLHKIRAPLRQVEGFKMGRFDELISSSSHRCDSEVEVQPMFEYPGKMLSPPQNLFELPFESAPPEKYLSKRGNVVVKNDGVFHGVVLWVDWDLGESTVSSGLNSDVSWDMGTRQAVYFVQEPFHVKKEEVISFEVTLKPQVGLFAFKFVNSKAENLS